MNLNYIELLKISVIYRYWLPAVITYLLLYLLLGRVLEKFKISKKAITKGQLFHEFLWSTITRIIFIFITLIIIYLRSIDALSTNIFLPESVYFSISLLFIFMFHDMYFYWTHRWLHTNQWLLKNVHSLHHRSNNPTPLAANSFHPIEAIINGLYLIIALIIFPVHPLAIIIESLASVFMGVYSHLGYEFIPNKVRNHKIGKFIMTSTVHNTHHSNYRYNYGFYLLFWDRALKTFKE